ncbi:MAG: DUF2179 domain-containing protein [Candidatus Palauibacterales bacterium]|nr:DUF2179 domain-containing protein [Candidatus Palauibacterales bacterium]
MIDLLAGPWGPLIIFFLRIGDVSLATVRIVLAVKGQRLLPPLIGFFEILIWVVAAGSVVQNLSSPLHVIGYAAGFATGTHVGLWIEARLALGLAAVQIVTSSDHRELAARLREEGFGVTEMEGTGRLGPVNVLLTSVRRRNVPRVMQVVDEIEPGSFVSVQDDRLVRRGWMLDRRRK